MWYLSSPEELNTYMRGSHQVPAKLLFICIATRLALNKLLACLVDVSGHGFVLRS